MTSLGRTGATADVLARAKDAFLAVNRKHADAMHKAFPPRLALAEGRALPADFARRVV